MEEKKVKATEKLAALEQLTMSMARRVGELELVLYTHSRENEILKEALQLINQKLDAVVTLSSSGAALTDENINSAIVSMKEQELKSRVDTYVQEGRLVAAEEVGDDSMIVSRELNEAGEVINPRLQFVVGKLIDELKSKFVGKKVGDLIKGDEGKLDIEIIEIYNIVEEQQAEQEAELLEQQQA
jgi:hypothetical protein